MYLVYSGAFGRIRQLYFRKILDRLALPSTATILDYGCGPGDFLQVARSAGVQAVGIDRSPRSVHMARERGLSVTCGDSSDLVQGNYRFDAIIVQSVLEHVQDGVQLVNDLRSLLVPGGVLVLSAPTPGPFFWDDPTHVRPFTPKSFAILAEIAQLDCEYAGYVFAFILGLQIRTPIIFQLLNLSPASLGSNLIAFMRAVSDCKNVQQPADVATA